MKAAAAVIGLVLIIFLIIAIIAFPAMLLWNGCLVPAIAGISEVGYFQMMGIIVLFTILFKPGNSQIKK